MENGFHFGGAEYIDLLVVIKPVKIATAGNDHVKFVCQVDEVLYGSHSFLIGVMAFKSKQSHLFQLFEQDRNVFFFAAFFGLWPIFALSALAAVLQVFFVSSIGRH